jgi:hypothetical protein
VAAPFEVDEQQRDGRRRHPLDARGLSHGLRTMLRELLLHFSGKPANRAVIQVRGNVQLLLAELAPDLVALPLDVPLVLGHDLDLLAHFEVVVGGRAPGDQRVVRHIGAPQELEQRALTIQHLPQDIPLFFLGNRSGAGPCCLEQAGIALDGFALLAKPRPAGVAHEAQPSADFREPQVGVVLA